MTEIIDVANELKIIAIQIDPGPESLTYPTPMVQDAHVPTSVIQPFPPSTSRPPFSIQSLWLLHPPFSIPFPSLPPLPLPLLPTPPQPLPPLNPRPHLPTQPHPLN